MRRIDHIVVAVRDLDAAAEFYRKLGFQVGVRNRHPWGTENRLIQFATSFIELITYAGNGSDIPRHEPHTFSFGRFVSDYLSRREGLAMLSLDSTDAKTDAARFEQQGLGAFSPFFFERKGRRPDGTETHVAFTLAFARDAKAPDAAFFVCQQHHPDRFWNADLQRHPNGATDISAVTLTAPEPEAHATFLAGFCGVAAAGNGGGLRLDVLDGHVTVDRDVDGAAGSPRFTAFTVAVNDTARLAKALKAAGIPFTANESLLVVSSHTAFGVGIAFQRAVS